MDGLILIGVTGGFFAAVVAALCAIAYLTGGPGDGDPPSEADGDLALQASADRQ